MYRPRERTLPRQRDGPAHDAYTRRLHRCRSDAEALWREVKPCVALVGDILVGDDSTLNKFYTCQWLWLTQLKANRLVDLEGTDNRPIREGLIPISTQQK